MASIGEIAAVLRNVVTPGMPPKAIRAAVRETYPDAGKKEIVRAAFYALTDAQAQDGAALGDLHAFALGERASDEEPDAGPKLAKRRKKVRRDEKPAQPSAA